MSQPFIGEIRMFGLTFAPQHWAKCDGQSMPINDNTALFSLLGITFGGDGRTTFNLPDFRGRVPIHIGDYTTNYGTFTYNTGTKGGAETVTLNLNEMPAHSHTAYGVNQDGDERTPSNTGLRMLGNMVTASSPYYGPASNLTNMGSPSVLSALGGPGGGAQSHPNIQPTLVVNFCISLSGLYPPRN